MTLKRKPSSEKEKGWQTGGPEPSTQGKAATMFTGHESSHNKKKKRRGRRGCLPQQKGGFSAWNLCRWGKKNWKKLQGAAKENERGGCMTASKAF